MSEIGRREMKFRQLDWLSDFILMFSLFIAMESLRRLHSLRQPLSEMIGEATFAAAVFTAVNWTRKHKDG